MTIVAGRYLVGLKTADGKLLVMPTSVPLNGDHCVLAKTSDEIMAACRVQSMTLEGQIGFRARTSDGGRAAFGYGALQSCVTEHGLGLGGLSYMPYPPITINLSDFSQVDLGHSALVGQVADAMLGIGSGVWEPSALAGSRTFYHIDQTGTVPAIVSVAHHRLKFGANYDIADAIDLRGVAPGQTDGIWYWAEPEPVVIPNRIFELPRWHDPGTNPVPPNAALDSYDYEHSLFSQRQVWLNLKAGLSFPGNGTIRLTLRVYAVVLCGLMADYNFRIPRSFQPNGPFCFGSLDISGTGGWARPKPGGDIPSLGCCICACPAQPTGCWSMRFGINALACYSGAYAACVPSDENYVWEFALHGGMTRWQQTTWPYPETSEDVTLDRLRAVFGFTGSINEWITKRFQARFNVPAPASIAIGNTADTGDDLTGFTDNAIRGVVTVPSAQPLGSATPPAYMVGGTAIPASSFIECLPTVGGNPVLPKFQVTNLDGYIDEVAHEHQYVVSDDDVTSVHSNTSDYHFAMQQFFTAWNGFPTSFPSSRGVAANSICITKMHYDAFLAGVTALLAKEWTNLPLIAHDLETDEYLFGYPHRAPSLWSPTADFLRLWYQGHYGWGVWRNTNLYPPERPEVAGEWELLHQGGRVMTSTAYWPDPGGDPGGGTSSGPGDCSHLLAAEGPFLPLMVESGTWPKVYHLAQPTLIIGVQLDGCSVRVRVYYLDWLILATTYWLYLIDPCQNGCYATSLGNNSSTMQYPFLEIGQGGKSTLGGVPVLGTDELTHMLSSRRSMGMCKSAALQPVTVCGGGNACEVSF